MSVFHKKTFRFFHLYISLILSAVCLTWFSQKSINAYWQQTYHQASTLEKLERYEWWRIGGEVQDNLNTAYQNGLTWLETQNKFWQNHVGQPQIRETLSQEKLPENKEISNQILSSSSLDTVSEITSSVKTGAGDKIILSKNNQVLLAGDSMMQGVAPFIQKWLSQDYGINSFNLSKQSTGLSYPSFFDWPATIEKQLREHANIKLLIIFLGPNDPWDFPNPNNKAQILRFKSPEWESVYRSRVARIINAAQQHQVQVVWYGIPYMKTQKLNQQMLYLDAVLEDELKNKALWIPTKQMLSQNTNQYSDSVSIDGKKQRVRSKDGIHFTPTGQKRLAEEIKQYIQVIETQPAS